MKADPKAVAKLLAEAKDAKKQFADAVKQMDSASSARATAVGAYTSALAKIKLDGEIKEGDFNNAAKAEGVLRKALVTEQKGHIHLDRAAEVVGVAMADLLNAQQKK